MCGIAGYAGGFQEGLISQMNDIQKHRGPDGHGVYEQREEGLALGHVRLAILDLTDSASQPMVSTCQRHVLTYNGEIYNFGELRAELEEQGAKIKSTGDTEVILQGLAMHGSSFIERLNGMFALAVWDRQERTLLLARDRMGVKPLYYYQLDDGALIFASEMKALLQHADVRREPDFQALVQHLGFCHAGGSRTALKGVKKVPPGHVLCWKASERKIETSTFWSAQYTNDLQSHTSEEIAEQLREQVNSAVSRQMVSDVSVGAFLSGGIDSSLIVQEAARGRDFPSYTITYQSSENRIDQILEDAPYARQMAESVGSELHEIEINADVAQLLPKLVWHLDEPIADPAAITCYLISKLGM